jgi:outer membrane protein
LNWGRFRFFHTKARVLRGTCLFTCAIADSFLIISILGFSGMTTLAQLPGQQRQSNQTQQTQNQSEPSPTQRTSNGNQVGGPGSQRRGNAQQVQGAAKVSPAVSNLSLEQAIMLALENNLTTLLAKEHEKEARGFQKESLAGLLPNISGNAYQASITENLAALGFTPGSFPGFTSTFIGPFKNFDARVRLQQTIFNLSALKNYQAERASVRATQMEEDLAREQVATVTSLAYLETMRTERSVFAAEANVTLAQTLLKLAQDQHDAGIATGVDVTRAETRLAQEQVRLSRAQTDSEEARLQLQRIIGLPLGSPFALTDTLRFSAESLTPIESAVATAEDNRAEVHVARAEVMVNGYEKRAAQAEQLPWLEFLGDYGVSAITPVTSALPTRRYAIQLNVPIFNGGLTRGRIQVASSRKSQAELQLASIQGQVEEDVRLAYSGLRTTAQTVRAADLAVVLAERELEMARDRFRAGVGDNIELVNAQAALANARMDQVTALALYNGARLNLAAALGRAQTFHW